MASNWSNAERQQRADALADARQSQERPEAVRHAFEVMKKWGARNLLKFENPGPPKGAVRGYIGLLNSVIGQTPVQVAKNLGLKFDQQDRPIDLIAGANVYRLRRLPRYVENDPTSTEFEVRGHTTLPDGGALPPGRKTDEAGYRAGEGSLQWRLKNDIEAEFLGVLKPNQPFSLEALGKPAQLSGEAWWHANQAKYPNSDRVGALKPVFEQRVSKFLAALRSAGAMVTVSATRRHRVRAHLMLYSYLLSRGEIQARNIPPIEGCDIIWDHCDEKRSREAAAEMARLFNVVYKPSLTSLHITGEAIDMTITWSSEIRLTDANGRSHVLAGPGDGSSSHALHKIGASYGVVKLLSDRPHWSVNGH